MAKINRTLIATSIETSPLEFRKSPSPFSTASPFCLNSVSKMTAELNVFWLHFFLLNCARPKASRRHQSFMLIGSHIGVWTEKTFVGMKIIKSFIKPSVSPLLRSLRRLFCDLCRRCRGGSEGRRIRRDNRLIKKFNSFHQDLGLSIKGFSA